MEQTADTPFRGVLECQERADHPPPQPEAQEITQAGHEQQKRKHDIDAAARQQFVEKEMKPAGKTGAIEPASEE
jgi:hypothetical protein